MVAVAHDPVSTGFPDVAALALEQLPLRVRVRRDQPQLELLYYEASLPELGLEFGEVDPTIECRRSCALALPNEREVFNVKDGRAESIASPAPLTDAVLDVLIPDRGQRCGAQCLQLSLERLPLEPGRYVRVLTALPDERIAVFLDDGSSVLVSSEGTLESGCSLPSGVPPVALWQDAEGRVWVSREDGVLVTLRAEELYRDGACVIESSTVAPSAEPFLHLAGNTDPSEPAEIFALASDRRFWRHADGTWQLLGGLEDPSPDSIDPEGHHNRRRLTGGVFWLGPGRAATFQLSREIQIYEDGRLRRFDVPALGGGGRLLSGTQSEEYGLLLSMQNVGLVTAPRIDGPWSILTRYPVQRIGAITPHRGQLLVSSTLQLEAIHPELGPCSRVDLPNSDYIRAVQAFPNSNAVLIADHHESQPVDPQTRELGLLRVRLACEGP